jgi:hypothetical protein
MELTESTGGKQTGHHLFRAGVSGNPAGRPRGARHKLGMAFLEALEADFNEHGAEAIAAVREKRPDKYMAVIAHLLPREMELSADISHTLSIELKEFARDYKIVRQAQLAIGVEPALLIEADDE